MASPLEQALDLELRDDHHLVEAWAGTRPGLALLLVLLAEPDGGHRGVKRVRQAGVESVWHDVALDESGARRWLGLESRSAAQAGIRLFPVTPTEIDEVIERQFANLVDPWPPAVATGFAEHGIVDDDGDDLVVSERPHVEAPPWEWAELDGPSRLGPARPARFEHHWREPYPIDPVFRGAADLRWRDTDVFDALRVLSPPFVWAGIVARRGPDVLASALTGGDLRGPSGAIERHRGGDTDTVRHISFGSDGSPATIAATWEHLGTIAAELGRAGFAVEQVPGEEFVQRLPRLFPAAPFRPFGSPLLRPGIPAGALGRMEVGSAEEDQGLSDRLVYRLGDLGESLGDGRLSLYLETGSRPSLDPAQLRVDAAGSFDVDATIDAARPVLIVGAWPAAGHGLADWELVVFGGDPLMVDEAFLTALGHAGAEHAHVDATCIEHLPGDRQVAFERAPGAVEHWARFFARAAILGGQVESAFGRAITRRLLETGLPQQSRYFRPDDWTSGRGGADRLLRG